MPRIFRIAIVGIPLLTLIAIVPGVRLAALAAMGRATPCSFTQAVNSFAVLKGRLERSDAIRSSARLLQSDGLYEQWSTGDGDYWIPKRNGNSLFDNLAEQEENLYGTGSVGVQAGDTVLDAGANIGVYTRKALRAGARMVISIEPAPENVECLRRNFPAEILDGRVRIEPVGVWDAPGELSLNIDADTSARNGFVGQYGAVASTVKVEVVTIDTLVDRDSLARVDFIKMDIEGAEKRALMGAAKTLARFHPRLAIATEHLSDDATAIPALLLSLDPGYRTICGPCVDARTKVRPDALYFVAK